MDQKMNDSRQRLISEGAREEVLDEWEELAFQVTSAVFKKNLMEKSFDEWHAHTKEVEARSRDKLRYRYPGGESYLDVVERIRPVILELERTHSSVLVISHRAVLRVVFAYFTGRPASLSAIQSITQ